MDLVFSYKTTKIGILTKNAADQTAVLQFKFGGNF